MSAATNLVSGASSKLASSWFPATTRAQPLDVPTEHAPRPADVRPSRVGGAPLAGAQAVTAYQRTSTLDTLVVLSRIDERV